MRRPAQKQICALFPVKTPKFSIRVIVASLVFAGFTSSGFLPLPVKIPLLALSAVLSVTYFLKKKKYVDESAGQHKNLARHHIGMVDQHFQQKTQQAVEPDGEGSAVQMIKFGNGLLDFPAGGGSSDESTGSETFELNFINSESGSCSPQVCSSEEDDNDDRSLIEISLPSNVCLDDFSPKSIIEKQEGREILTDDINEEDNLIELDISMGSIRCSKF